MAKRGKTTGTSGSAELLAADEYRGYVTIMLQSDNACALAFEGEAAIADQGVMLNEVGDSVEVLGELARGQINVIGNNAALTWQEGPVKVRRLGITS